MSDQGAFWSRYAGEHLAGLYANPQLSDEQAESLALPFVTMLADRESPEAVVQALAGIRVQMEQRGRLGNPAQTGARS